MGAGSSPKQYVMNATINVHNGSVGLIGAELLGLRNNIEARRFLRINALYMAQHLLELEATDIRVGFFSGIIDDMLVGIRSSPLVLNERFESPNAKLVLFYNVQYIDKAVAGEFSVDESMYILWRWIISGIRLSVTRKTKNGMARFVPGAYGNEIGFDALCNAAIRRFNAGNWPPTRVREELDAAIVGQYATTILWRCTKARMPVSFQALRDIVLLTNAENYRDMMPILHPLA